MVKSRIFAVLAAMAMGLAFFGCSDGNSDSGPSDDHVISEPGNDGSDGDSGSSDDHVTIIPPEPGNDDSDGSSETGSEGGATDGPSSGDSGKIPEDFVKIPGYSKSENETLTPGTEIYGEMRGVSSFYMCNHEVTRGEYKTVTGKNPSKAPAYENGENELTGDDVINNPVDAVSWYEALAYCNMRSIKEGLKPYYYYDTEDGKITDPNDWGDPEADFGSYFYDSYANGYRLPTEAEWEWAARGGENVLYAGSDDAREVAWVECSGTRPVKTKKANGYGLYDMSGNVGEWCWDSYSTNYGERCIRGGSWESSRRKIYDITYESYTLGKVYEGAEVNNQNGGSQTKRFKDVGFRVVRHTPEPFLYDLETGQQQDIENEE